MESVRDNGFADTAEEISFFKVMKPKLESLVIYYKGLYRIEMGKPVEILKYQKVYYENELEKINQFFEENKFLVGYYRSGEIFLDDKFFVRSDTGTNHLNIGNIVQYPALSAVGDRFVAEFMANELLARHLIKAIARSQEGKEGNYPEISRTQMKWTDTKTALIELLYALYRKGSINDGNADIKDIAVLLENIFGVDLGNYYRIFQQIRIRKTGRTNFLDALKSGLIEYMDETDLNY